MQSLPGAFVLSLLLVAASGCERRLPEYELHGETMGTSYSIRLVAPPEALSRQALEADIAATLDGLVALASTWEADSEISRFNANPSSDWIRVSAPFCRLVEDALAVSERTGGAFDITVGPIVNLWGFGSAPRLMAPPSDDDRKAVLERVGYRRIETRCQDRAIRKSPGSVYVDLSGWAKGHAVDRLAAVLDTVAVTDYLVEIGGELRVRGKNAEGAPWRIAIEKPLALSREPYRVLRLSDTAVATSGDYRNYFADGGRRYSHIVDARTGRPVQHDLAAVTVIAESTAEADAMATALQVLGPDDGPRLAEELGLAAFFLVRRDDALEARTTIQFDRMVSL